MYFLCSHHDEFLDCFQFRATTRSQSKEKYLVKKLSNAAKYTSMDKPPLRTCATLFQSGDLEVELLGLWLGTSFTLLDNDCQITFQSSCSNLYSSKQCMKVPVSPYFH